MRTVTDLQTAIFTGGVPKGALPSVYARVEIYNGTSWIRMDALNGRDYVQSVSYTQSRNEPVAGATIVLRTDFLDAYARSISPEQGLSVPNDPAILCKFDRQIRVYTATVPLGNGKPDSGSSVWALVFRGRIDKVSWTYQTVTLECRDQGGELQDTWIEKIDSYGDDATPVDVEDVIQSLLTTWARTSTTLYSANGTSGTPFAGGDSPGFGIQLYNQQRQSIMDAITVLADQIGYSIRYRYHEGSGINDFVLVLEEPDRSTTTSIWTIGKSSIYDLSITEDGDTVRNVIIGTYSDKDNGGQRTVDSTSGVDATSISNHGRRFMHIGEASTSQINTSTEMSTMLTAFKNDLKDSYITSSVKVPYSYHLQVNDYVTIEADKRLLYTDVDAAILSITHTIDSNGGWTDLQVRGKPTSGEQWHVLKETRDRLSKTNGTDIGAGIWSVPGSDSVLTNGQFGDFGRG